MKRRGGEVKKLGQILVQEPKAFPGALLAVCRRSVRTLWKARGGGFYASGYVITFLWLEIAMFVDDVMSADSVGAFFEAQIFEMLFRYLGESFQNMIVAFAWPVFVLQYSPEWGIVFLALMYLVFTKLLKARLERWLFRDDATPHNSRAPSAGAQEDNQTRPG